MTNLRDGPNAAANGGVDSESYENSSDSKSETPLVFFNRQVIALISMYEKYRNEPTSSGEKIDEDTTTTKSQLLDEFINKFDDLIEYILATKRNDFHTFKAFFLNMGNATSSTSLVAIQFYEFLNKLLSVHDTDGYISVMSGASENNGEYLLTHMMGLIDATPDLESKTLMISRSLQLLNILVSSLSLTRLILLATPQNQIFFKLILFRSELRERRGR